MRSISDLDEEIVIVVFSAWWAHLDILLVHGISILTEK
jgi:hypothetical protein